MVVARAVLWGGVSLIWLSLACEGEDPDDGDGGGTSGSSSGGSVAEPGRGGAGGGASQAGAGSAGDSAIGGSGGRAAGMAGMGPSGAAGHLGTDGVDLALGGLNQDLEMPVRDCLDMLTIDPGCMSVSGEYNGEAFDYACNAQGPIQIALVSSDTSRQIGCAADVVPDDELRVAMKLGKDLFGTLPTDFERSTDRPGESTVAVSRDERKLQTNQGDEFLIADTHTLEWAIAGEAILGPGRSEENTAEYARGTFAMTLTPVSGCAPDADGLGCDAVRLRGTFNVQTIPVLVLGDEGDDCIALPGQARCAAGLECSIEPGAELGVCVPR